MQEPPERGEATAEAAGAAAGSASASSGAGGAGAASSSSTAPPAAAPVAAAPSAAPANGALEEIPEVPNPEDPRDTDMMYFQQFCTFQPKDFPSRKVKALGEALLGKVELHAVAREDGEVPLAMKKMPNRAVDECRSREVNGRRESTTEDALTEIGTLIYLSRKAACESIMRLDGCYRDGRHTWLATEFCDQGELFALVQSRPATIGDREVRDFMRQLLQAVNHLHRHNVGHRDISLENILVQGGNRLKLMDFGQACLCRTRDGRPFRYFRPAGKHYYRAPEVYSPSGQFMRVQVVRPEGATGSTVQVRPEQAKGFLYEVRLPDGPAGSPCVAELAGYEVERMDAFACGVSMWILQTKVPPWKAAFLGDATFKYVFVNGLQRLYQEWRLPALPAPGMELLSGLLCVNPAQRCSVQQALESAWLHDGVAGGENADMGGCGGGEAT